MADLLLYSRALLAVRECKSVDEVLEIRAKATAVSAYAQQARNRELELDAMEIRIRATRRLGQMLIAIHSEQNSQTRLDSRAITALADRFNLTRPLAQSAINAARASDLEHDKSVTDWRQRCIEQGRVTSRLVPAAASTTEIWKPAPPPPRPPGPLDNWCCRDDTSPIGDWHVDELRWSAESMRTEAEILFDILEAVGNSVVTEQAIGRRLKVREVLSNKKLAAILLANGVKLGDAA